MTNDKYIGNKFHKLTILSRIEKTEKYLCQCECGNIKEINRKKINITKSCGCLNKRLTSKQDIKMNSAYKIFKVRYSDGDLTFEDFYLLSQQKCTYCGREPYTKYNAVKEEKNYRKYDSFSLEEASFTYNGLDRIDSKLMHTKDNVTPCCKVCNLMKSNLNIEDFDEKLLLIYLKFMGN